MVVIMISRLSRGWKGKSGSRAGNEGFLGGFGRNETTGWAANKVAVRHKNTAVRSMRTISKSAPDDPSGVTAFGRSKSLACCH